MIINVFDHKISTQNEISAIFFNFWRRALACARHGRIGPSFVYVGSLPIFDLRIFCWVDILYHLNFCLNYMLIIPNLII